jgi:hypothetical protein
MLFFEMNSPISRELVIFNAKLSLIILAIYLCTTE